MQIRVFNLHTNQVWVTNRAKCIYAPRAPHPYGPQGLRFPCAAIICPFIHFLLFIQVHTVSLWNRQVDQTAPPFNHPAGRGAGVFHGQMGCNPSSVFWVYHLVGHGQIASRGRHPNHIAKSISASFFQMSRLLTLSHCKGVGPVKRDLDTVQPPHIFTTFWQQPKE